MEFFIIRFLIQFDPLSIIIPALMPMLGLLPLRRPRDDPGLLGQEHRLHERGHPGQCPQHVLLDPLHVLRAV